MIGASLNPNAPVPAPGSAPEVFSAWSRPNSSPAPGLPAVVDGGLGAAAVAPGDGAGDGTGGRGRAGGLAGVAGILGRGGVVAGGAWTTRRSPSCPVPSSDEVAMDRGV